VHLEEPRAGLQFGFELADQQPAGGVAYVLPVRTPGTGTETGQTVAVPFRQNAPGVVDLADLQKRILAAVGGDGSGAEFALQALRFPYRQVFGPGTGNDQQPTFGQLFQPQVGLAEMREWPSYQVTAAENAGEAPA
jgi:hypothetical protein